jgi:hypothetical protein
MQTMLHFWIKKERRMKISVSTMEKVQSEDLSQEKHQTPGFKMQAISRKSLVPKRKTLYNTIERRAFMGKNNPTNSFTLSVGNHLRKEVILITLNKNIVHIKVKVNTLNMYASPKKDSLFKRLLTLLAKFIR